MTQQTDDWGNLRAHWAECAKQDPDYRLEQEKAPLQEMFNQYNILKSLGWKEAIYCPKDGSEFLCIEAGSTGVHLCRYDGEWPKGVWWIMEAGDMWPSRPILWKPIPAKT